MTKIDWFMENVWHDHSNAAYRSFPGIYFPGLLSPIPYCELLGLTWEDRLKHD